MLRLKTALLAIAAPVGACATKSPDALPEVPSGYNFAYVASQGAEVGLVQAFDDGAHTYLQFNGPTPDLGIRHGVGEPILPFRTDRQYILLDGVYDRLNISLKQSSTAIINEAAERTQSAPEPESLGGAGVSPGSLLHPDPARPLAAVGVPEALQTMHANLRVAEINRELTQLEERVRFLTDCLDAAHRESQALNLSVRRLAVSSRIVIRFDDNRADAIVDSQILEPLGAAARAANRIYLHGHTDAYVASGTGTQLAIERAAAVRRLLVAQDVAPGRVRLFYRGAGNFLANNSTADGKAMNRRVEIEFRKW